eukprot:tig00000073_g1726.t1
MAPAMRPAFGSSAPQGLFARLAHSVRDHKSLFLLFHVAGIYFSYMSYAVVQERIASARFGEKGERFHYVLFMMAIQCSINAAFAYFCMDSSEDSPPTKGSHAIDRVYDSFTRYAPVAFTYLAAMWCSNAALKFVSYPTQVLAKSCKMIPVMLMEIAVNKKRYRPAEYFCVCLVTAGIFMFMIQKGGGGGGPQEGAKGGARTLGLALLGLSLCMDAFTGPFQERIMHKHSPSTRQVMLNLNAWSVALLVAALVITGEGVRAFAFVARYPGVLLQVAMFSCCSAVGQSFIFSCIHHFDALVCTTVTTTRKFFTILASVLLPLAPPIHLLSISSTHRRPPAPPPLGPRRPPLWFRHALSLGQWAGVALVFSGLGYNIYVKHAGSGAAPRVKLKAALL